MQLATFGRRLDGRHDALPGFEMSQGPTDDPAEMIPHRERVVELARVVLPTALL